MRPSCRVCRVLGLDVFLCFQLVFVLFCRFLCLFGKDNSHHERIPDVYLYIYMIGIFLWRFG